MVWVAQSIGSVVVDSKEATMMGSVYYDCIRFLHEIVTGCCVHLFADVQTKVLWCM